MKNDEERFKIEWPRTGKSTTCPATNWMNEFHIIDLPVIRVGSTIEPLPGKQLESVFKPGDKGIVANVSAQSNLEIEWQRTGRISSYPKAKWMDEFRLVEQ